MATPVPSSGATGPAVILAGSGMCTGGRIKLVHGEPRAQNTLGKRLEKMGYAIFRTYPEDEEQPAKEARRRIMHWEKQAKG